jgi:cell wall-associated NlpC family hydrolase
VTSSGGLSALALSEIAAGAILAWSGIENASLKATVTSLISGKAPRPSTGTDAIAQVAPVAAASSVASATTSSAIANDALRYSGHAYLFGGAPGPDGSRPWDCSSFASWVLGHDLGFALPGGSWASVTASGAEHGPSTISYLSWSGAQTVGHTASVAQPGDLLVWQTHCGFCIGPNEMISAQDEALGTGTSVITGAIPGELLFVRRVVIGNPEA